MIRRRRATYRATRVFPWAAALWFAGCVLDDPFVDRLKGPHSPNDIPTNDSLKSMLPDTGPETAPGAPPEVSIVSDPVPPFIEVGVPDADVGPTPECEVPTDCQPPATCCQEVVCNDGACELMLAQSGSNCTAFKFKDEIEVPSCDGPERCDPEGACVSCRVDGKPNDRETDADCGGEDCPACGDGKQCLLDRDCESKVCSNFVCLPPTCNDGKKNGDEGDTDCGGDRCAPCLQGDGCLLATDCETGFCSDGVCCGVACTGLCQQCQKGSGACGLVVEGEDPRDDCLGSACDGSGQCASCFDTEQNGDETDLNCGGSCAPCGETKRCNVNDDCESGFCEDTACVPPRCNDNQHNGDETAIDCGGACGPFCAPGEACRVKIDCASGSCEDGKCVGP